MTTEPAGEPAPAADAPPPAPAKKPLKERLKALLAEYGQVAIWTYLVMWLGVWAGFYIAIKAGAKPEGATGSATTIGAAWVATKLTQPIRILVTLAITPGIAAIIGRIKRKKRTPPPV